MNDKEIVLPRVLLDTGSAATVFNTDDMLKLDVRPQPDAPIRFMTGVGGREPVIEVKVQSVAVDDLVAMPFTIQMGRLAYGLQMDGILGLDFLRQVQALIDLRELELRPGQ
jgi:hypothetical protein